ncbi:MAG: polysaccharide biosynthesis protein [Oscillospiraceae bacterium]|nr:polysaccharide biosynthesis protein [Oscillospiraceae bacterium]
MEEKKKKGFHLEYWQLMAIFLISYDLLAIHAAYFGALWLRFDFVFSRIPPEYILPYRRFITPYAVGCVVVFWFFRMYRGMWSLAGLKELLQVLEASLITSLLHAVLITVLIQRMPISYYVLGAVFQAIFLSVLRFLPRLLSYERIRQRGNDETADRVMLIGAGAAGQMILHDVMSNGSTNDRIVCVIDDNANKWNRDIDGVPVVGGREDILAAVERYHVNKIFFAIPSATAEQKRDILNICNETNCELKQLPGLYQFVLGEVSVSAMKDVSVEDLLGREPIQTELKEVFDFVHGKSVLVTGGGGSIGSELCRQIAAHGPRQLIILDIYENNAYDIQLELREKYPELDLKVLIGSVRDSGRMMSLFEEYRPQLVYHAAAHKHVPLMEDSPCEAIKNNAIGTYKTAYAAMVHGCKRFVLISTDKAVNPTNIMGASKRLCEMIIQSFDTKIKAGRAADIPQLFTHYTENGREQLDPKENPGLFANIRTEFVAVRFGNVLGSNGSVIPIFKKQIENGGPVTVTHPDIIRYFMTIPEAVSLVLLAGTNAKGGEIFVLDMGSPVKIDTLARNLIRLSGLRPDVDIMIEYTGLRPGEKLYEEKLMAEEGIRKTENEKIHIGCPLKFDVDMFLEDLDGLMEAAYMNRRDIKQLVAGMVSTYHQEGVEAVDGETYRKLLKESELVAVGAGEND